MSREENESLLGLEFEANDDFITRIFHAKGGEERIPLDRAPSGPQPQTWEERGGALETKRHGLTRDERIQQSLRVEATLMKALRSDSTLMGPLTNTKMLLCDLLKAMGHGWEHIAHQHENDAMWERMP